MINIILGKIRFKAPWLYNFKRKEILRIQNLQNNLFRIKVLLENLTNIKRNIFAIWKFILLCTTLILCSVTLCFAMNIKLQWNPNSEPDLAGYRVFYRVEGQSYDYTNPYWECIDTKCIIYDLDKTKTYYFVVRAFDTNGFESDNSDEISYNGIKLTADFGSNGL